MFNNKLLFSICFLLISITILTNAKKPNENKQVSPDEKSLDIKTKFLSQEIFNKNKVTLINFWASWCTPCLSELPALNRLYQLKKDSGFAVVGINTDYENQRKISQKIIKEYDLKFSNQLDKGGKLVDAFKIIGIPTSLLVKNGIVIREIKGEFDFNSSDFVNSLDTLLAK